MSLTNDNNLFCGCVTTKVTLTQVLSGVLVHNSYDTRLALTSFIKFISDLIVFYCFGIGYFVVWPHGSLQRRLQINAELLQN